MIHEDPQEPSKSPVEKTPPVTPDFQEVNFSPDILRPTEPSLPRLEIKNTESHEWDQQPRVDARALQDAIDRFFEPVLQQWSEQFLERGLIVDYGSGGSIPTGLFVKPKPSANPDVEGLFIEWDGRVYLPDDADPLSDDFVKEFEDITGLVCNKRIVRVHWEEEIPHSLYFGYYEPNDEIIELVGNHKVEIELTAVRGNQWVELANYWSEIYSEDEVSWQRYARQHLRDNGYPETEVKLLKKFQCEMARWRILAGYAHERFDLETPEAIKPFIDRWHERPLPEVPELQCNLAPRPEMPRWVKDAISGTEGSRSNPAPIEKRDDTVPDLGSASIAGTERHLERKPSPEVSQLGQSLVMVSKEVLELMERGLQTQSKEDGTDLTNADIHVHNFLGENLRWIVDRQVVSEEGLPKNYGTGSLKDGYWLIDPIDGTHNMRTGKGDFGISVALIEDGRPILSAVAIPQQQKVYIAERGNGVWLKSFDEELLSNVRPRAEKEHLESAVSYRGRNQSGAEASRDRIVSSFGFDPEQTTPISASAVRYLDVGLGRVDLAAGAHLSGEWDIAGVDLLLEELGCSLINLADMRKVQYDSTAGKDIAGIVAIPNTHLDALVNS